MAITDKVRHLRGTRIKVPSTLESGRIIVLEDEKRLIFSTSTSIENVPNQADLQNITDIANGAVDTANTASTNISQALTVANQADATSNIANAQSIATQNQVANIIAHNGDGTKDTEVVDSRTDSNGNVYDSMGGHIRNLDLNFNTLKDIQTYIANADNISVIPIEMNNIDLTKCNFDITYEGVQLEEITEYTIDTVNNNINLVGWTINTGAKIKYRIYRGDNAGGVIVGNATVSITEPTDNSTLWFDIE